MKAIVFIIYLIVVIIGGTYLGFYEVENENITIFGHEYETNDVFGVFIVSSTFMLLGYLTLGRRKNHVGGFKKERILKEGIFARAKILEISDNDSGMVTTINDQPLVLLKLEIDKKDESPYTMEIQETIPRLAIPQIQPEKMIWVRIDPRDNKKVVIDPLNFSIDQTLSANTIGLDDWDKEDLMKIKNEGLEGKAEIIKVEDTGESKNSKIILDVSYKIELYEGEDYEINNKITSSTEAAKILKDSVGRKVPIRIHPENRERLIMRFNNLNIAQ
ncbi:MAG: hypothetical protein HQ538_04720 [Parcubacteria group bacterium]|nr:hypothetical protein [Parcubacteria group bacterium]